MGIIFGPFGCSCGWSESEEYDVTGGPNVTAGGYEIDQWGGQTAANSGKRDHAMTTEPSTIGTNSGHGHAWPRPDGVKARCGGPGICRSCAADKALVDRAAARCRSCDHLIGDHDVTGCWYTVTVGTDGRGLACPCSVAP